MLMLTVRRATKEPLSNVMVLCRVRPAFGRRQGIAAGTMNTAAAYSATLINSAELARQLGQWLHERHSGQVPIWDQQVWMAAFAGRIAGNKSFRAIDSRPETLVGSAPPRPVAADSAP